MEQLPRVVTGNLDAIRFADGRVVQPLSRLTHVLIRVVHRVQNAVGTDFGYRVDQSWRAKGATRSDVKILSQILRYR